MSPYIALAFGTVVGLAVQATSARLRYDEDWVQMAGGKKAAIIASGAIAALMAGLYTLDHPRPVPVTPYVYRMWLWQVVAAWGGGLVMDFAVNNLSRFVSRAGSEETEDSDG